MTRSPNRKKVKVKGNEKRTIALLVLSAIALIIVLAFAG
tara:strand:+ start:3753 stop:3869 length:117 start_codon:yes stop_codon:yes gene_type:complete